MIIFEVTKSIFVLVNTTIPYDDVFINPRAHRLELPIYVKYQP